MLAVIELAGKQFSVEEGTVLDVDQLGHETGKSLTINEVLLINDGKETLVGQPYVEGATVSLSVSDNFKDKKITVFKFKRKTGYKLTQGHRQKMSRVQVDKISKTGGKVEAKDAPAKKKAAPKTKAAEKE